MKNTMLILAVSLLLGYSASAQMTLEHSFPATSSAISEIVNLALSGRKILVTNNQSTPSDTLFFYNMDYSFWKKIICPSLPGYRTQAGSFRNGTLYPSETLFNSDPLLEAAVVYLKLTDSASPFPPSYTIFIINENSALMDSITNVSVQDPVGFQIFETSTGVFQATVSTINGISIYGLPGTIPCSICGNGMGISKVEKPTIPTEPMPNPSANEVKITFTLPQGVSQGELDLFDGAGKKIKSYQVDDRFGFIMLDNSQLTPGMYYYNIVANGQVSSTQKLVLVK